MASGDVVFSKMNMGAMEVISTEMTSPHHKVMLRSTDGTNTDDVKLERNFTSGPSGNALFDVAKTYDVVITEH